MRITKHFKILKSEAGQKLDLLYLLIKEVLIPWDQRTTIILRFEIAREIHCPYGRST